MFVDIKRLVRYISKKYMFNDLILFIFNELVDEKCIKFNEISEQTRTNATRPMSSVSTAALSLMSHHSLLTKISAKLMLWSSNCYCRLTWKCLRYLYFTCLQYFSISKNENAVLSWKRKQKRSRETCKKVSRSLKEHTRREQKSFYWSDGLTNWRNKCVPVFT